MYRSQDNWRYYRIPPICVGADRGSYDDHDRYTKKVVSAVDGDLVASYQLFAVISRFLGGAKKLEMKVLRWSA
jgi:hypothetical protein